MNIVSSGINTVIAANCFSCSGSILLMYFVANNSPNLFDSPINGNKSTSSFHKIGSLLISCFLNLSPSSFIVTISFSSIILSNGKYENLDNIRLSISLNFDCSNVISPLHFT